MKLELECMYCGHKWEKEAYNRQSVDAEICPRCKDSSLKVRDFNAARIDSYKGCPPFPPKKKDMSDWVFTGTDYAYLTGASY